MTSATGYLLAFIAVAAVATFLTRALPFVILSGSSEHPLARHLGRYLPASIMAVLVAVFLPQFATWSAPVFGLDALIPALAVVFVHLWRRNALLSMLVGTLGYMAIQQGVLY